MPSDLVFSSQPHAVKKKLTTADVLCLFDTDSEPFKLILSEEDSDWESDCLSHKSNLNNFNVEVVANNDFYVYSESPILFQDSSSVECSVTQYEKIKQEKIQCENQNENLFVEKNNCSFKTTLSVTCQTAFSQEFEDTLSKSFSEAYKSNWVQPVFDEIFTCIADSEKKISDLSFEKSTVIHYNIVACIVTCYPVRELWCKSKSCWQTMANIILGDYNNQYFRLVLWNQQCQSALSQCVGNLVYINQIQVSSFRGEVIFGLKPKSKMVTVCSLPVRNLNNFKQNIPFQNFVKLNSDWFRTTHNALCSNVLRSTLRTHDCEVHLCRIFELDCGKIVHVKVRLASISNISRNKNISPIVCVYNEEKPNFYCKLYLNGSSRGWVSLFKKYRHHLWEIRYVACVLTSNERMELHTTVFSTAESAYGEQPISADLFSSSRVEFWTANSHKQVIELVSGGKSGRIRCNSVCFDFIRTSSTDRRLSVNKSSSIKACQSWLEEVNKLADDSLIFELKCNFNRLLPSFVVQTTYDDLLQFLELQSLNPSHAQVKYLLLHNVC